MPDPDSTRVVVEVVGGLIPGQPEPEHSRRWAISSDDWEGMSPQQQSVALAELNGRAQGYAALLMLQPDRLNWVRLDWVWL